mmetsp:Transcript_1112/g.1455  ORF Transcript_1112/g.1455 Transcript_1112/m.1455 type:complete len:158 (+) Transcript_1112:24-497(+)
MGSFWISRPGLTLIACLIWDFFLSWVITIPGNQKKLFTAAIVFFITKRNVMATCASMIFPTVTLFWLGQNWTVLAENFINSKVQQMNSEGNRPSKSSWPEQQEPGNNSQKEDQTAKTRGNAVFGFDLDDAKDGEVLELSSISMKKRKTGRTRIVSVD